jgi:hypothetical protein
MRQFTLTIEHTVRTETVRETITVIASSRADACDKASEGRRVTALSAAIPGAFVINDNAHVVAFWQDKHAQGRAYKPLAREHRESAISHA